MWIADKWKDFEVLDCGNGEKVERWGKQVLVRPDPQAIWPKQKNVSAWRTADASYHRSSSGGGKALQGGCGRNPGFGHEL